MPGAGVGMGVWKPGDSDRAVQVANATGGGGALTLPTPPIANPVSYYVAGFGMFQLVNGTTAATATNDPVGYWTDQSGNAHHEIAAANDTTRPVLKLNQQNGYAAVSFDGSNDFLEAIYNQNAPLTIGVVCKRPSGTDAGGIWQAGGGSHFPYLYNWPATSNLIGYVRSGREMDVTGCNITSGYGVIISREQTNQFRISFRNSGGSVTGSDTGTQVNFTAHGLGAAPVGIRPIDILSIIMYDSALSDADMDTLRDWYATTVYNL